MLPDPFTVPATAPWPALVMRNKGPSSAKLNGIRRVDDTGAFESVITHDFNTKPVNDMSFGSPSRRTSRCLPAVS